jgi:hypothetical protein
MMMMMMWWVTLFEIPRPCELGLPRDLKGEGGWWVWRRYWGSSRVGVTRHDPVPSTWVSTHPSGQYPHRSSNHIITSPRSPRPSIHQSINQSINPYHHSLATPIASTPPTVRPTGFLSTVGHPPILTMQNTRASAHCLQARAPPSSNHEHRGTPSPSPPPTKATSTQCAQACGLLSSKFCQSGQSSQSRTLPKRPTPARKRM